MDSHHFSGPQRFADPYIFADDLRSLLGHRAARVGLNIMEFIDKLPKDEKESYLEIVFLFREKDIKDAFPGEDTSTIILSPVQPIAPGTTPDPQSIVDCLAAERSRTGITGRDVAERFRDTLNKQKLFTYALSIDTFNADNPTNLSDLSMTLKAMHKQSQDAGRVATAFQLPTPQASVSVAPAALAAPVAPAAPVTPAVLPSSTGSNGGAHNVSRNHPASRKAKQPYWIVKIIETNEPLFIANPVTHTVQFYQAFAPHDHLGSFLLENSLPVPPGGKNLDIDLFASQMHPALHQKYLISMARKIKFHMDREADVHEAVWARLGRHHRVRRPKIGPNAVENFEVSQAVRDILQLP